MGRNPAIPAATAKPRRRGARAPAGGGDAGVARRRSLAGYRTKRDFATTPEPAGNEAQERRRHRFFCVHKHLASHLHYDFRLEHGGVLLSWAVPKGPCLDPRVKRLAMQVEDHPLTYGGFEGVIPRGYGAGIVLLWDRGVWQPLVDDVAQALRRGSLPLVILGEKLKGAWTLVRAGGMGPKAWLLMKQRDRWADARDITLAAPASVASAGDLADILARQRANPWPDQPPAVGGDAGKLFRSVIAEAAALKRRR